MADEKKTVTAKTKTKKAAAKKAVAAKSVTKKAPPEKAVTAKKVTAAKRVTTKKAPAAPARPATRPAPATAARPTAPKSQPVPEPKGALPVNETPRTGTPALVSLEQRAAMIQEAAYYKAEKRGFAPGFESEDWDEAEREVDERLNLG